MQLLCFHLFFPASFMALTRKGLSIHYIGVWKPHVWKESEDPEV